MLLLFAELLYGLGSDESARNIQKWLEGVVVWSRVFSMEGGGTQMKRVKDHHWSSQVPWISLLL